MEFIIGAVSGALVGGTVVLITLSAIMNNGNAEKTEEKCQACSKCHADSLTVMIEPNGDVHLVSVPAKARALMLERNLGEEYSVYPCKELPIADTIVALASTDKRRCYNHFASELCHTELHGDVILMPVEDKHFVSWDYGRADILRIVVSGCIKTLKNREEAIYGKDRA